MKTPGAERSGSVSDFVIRDYFSFFLANTAAPNAVSPAANTPAHPAVCAVSDVFGALDVRVVLEADAFPLPLLDPEIEALFPEGVLPVSSFFASLL